jgi:hypothetical protein
MHPVVYSYHGEMNNTVLNSILFAMEQRMAAEGIRPPVIKKINSVLIECCQNLIHHSFKDFSDGQLFPSVSVAKDQDDYLIETRNVIHKSKVDSLRQYIDKINSMDKQELKEYFQTVLTNGKIGAHGGGGLGLLNIIRKSKDSTLHYTFSEANEEEMFFNLSFTI